MDSWSVSKFCLEFEAELEARRPQGWRRLTAEELAALSQSCACRYSMGWLIQVYSGEVLNPVVEYLWLVIDSHFPYSRPRILAPQVAALSWPHVEENGFLCLPKWRVKPSLALECINLVGSAIKLFNTNSEDRENDFRREFRAYWGRGATRPPARVLFSPNQQSKKILCAVECGQHGRIIFGSNRVELRQWICNSGLTPNQFVFERALYVWRSNPLLPSEFPSVGAELLSLIPIALINGMDLSGKVLRVLFASGTKTGPLFWGCNFSQAPYKVNGFRPGKIRFAGIKSILEANSVGRFEVERADAEWVHGRGRDAMSSVLYNKRVVIVGCGAIGSTVARLLAQAGVGRFVFIDDDVLKSHNTSRHALGSVYVGENKAVSMGKALKIDFPHLKEIQAIENKFERINPEDLGSLAGADLIISAGISLAGDASLDRWRRENAIPTPHLCAWAEAYAIVGHAVALFGADSLMDEFENDEPKFHATAWNGDELNTEAGCGNEFQPHGAADLQSTVVLASKLALDILLGKVSSSLRRTWFGHREAVVENGGKILPLFEANNAQREFSWPSD